MSHITQREYEEEFGEDFDEEVGSGHTCAFDPGYAAGVAGESIYTCPYQEGALYLDWMDGWHRGDSDRSEIVNDDDTHTDTESEPFILAWYKVRELAAMLLNTKDSIEIGLSRVSNNPDEVDLRDIVTSLGDLGMCVDDAGCWRREGLARRMSDDDFDELVDSLVAVYNPDIEMGLHQLGLDVFFISELDEADIIDEMAKRGVFFDGESWVHE